MPTKNKGATEQANENFNDRTDDVLLGAAVSRTPFVSVGVNRRINIGNYEHLDIYAGVAVPVGADMEEIKDDVSNSIADAMRVVSTETNNRYQMIKDAQGEGRPEGSPTN